MMYDTRPFCNVYKYEGMPVQVSEQMDVEEFFNMLFDRLESALKRENKVSKHLSCVWVGAYAVWYAVEAGSRIRTGTSAPKSRHAMGASLCTRDSSHEQETHARTLRQPMRPFHMHTQTRFLPHPAAQLREGELRWQADPAGHQQRVPAHLRARGGLLRHTGVCAVRP